MSRKTLLLTPWMFPVKVLPWEAAIKLRYEGLVDVVVEYADEVSSPSVTWKIPAVLRLRKLARRESREPKFSRLAVYQRDNFCCQYCGDKKPYHELTRDHVVPRAHGGRTTWLNCVAACRGCNSRKGSLSCDESGMFPMKAPVVPRALALIPPALGHEIPPEWEGFTAGF